MELNEKHIELIGAYLQGRLEGEELSAFLNEVEQNDLLKEELNIEKAILDGIEHKSNQEVRSRLKQISKEKNKKTDANTDTTTEKKTRIIPLRIVKIVSSIAAVAILCFAAYFLLDSPYDDNEIYAKYFEPSELTITRSTDMEADLVKVKELYNTQKYDEAEPLFKTIIANDPASSNLRLAYGNTLLKCKKINLAREQFQYILDAKDPLYSDQARWFLALLELKVGNLDRSKELLSLLGEDTSLDFHAEALQLLDELGNLK